MKNKNFPVWSTWRSSSTKQTWSDRGVDYELANIYTTAQAAEKLGVSKHLVIRLAHKMGLGKKVSEAVFIFTNQDIEVMENRNRVAGRPQENFTAGSR